MSQEFQQSSFGIGQDELGGLYFRVDLDDTGFQQGMKRVQQAAQNTGRQVGDIGQRLWHSFDYGMRGQTGIERLIGRMGDLAFATQNISQQLDAFVAPALRHSQALFGIQQAYGETAQSWIKWSKEMAAATTQSDESFLASAVNMRTLIDNYGLTEKQVRDLIKASADLAAVKGIDLYDAVERIQSAIRGEAEASEYLGLSLSETYMRNKAFGGSLRDTWMKLDDNTKAHYRYLEVLRQAGKYEDAAEEYRKTSAGQLMELRTRWEDLTAAIGNFLGPAQPVVAQFGAMGQAIGGIALAAGPAGAAIGKLVSALKNLPSKVVSQVAVNVALQAGEVAAGTAAGTAAGEALQGAVAGTLVTRILRPLFRSFIGIASRLGLSAGVSAGGVVATTSTAAALGTAVSAGLALVLAIPLIIKLDPQVSVGNLTQGLASAGRRLRDVLSTVVDQWKSLFRGDLRGSVESAGDTLDALLGRMPARRQASQALAAQEGAQLANSELRLADAIRQANLERANEARSYLNSAEVRDRINRQLEEEARLRARLSRQQYENYMRSLSDPQLQIKRMRQMDSDLESLRQLTMARRLEAQRTYFARPAEAAAESVEKAQQAVEEFMQKVEEGRSQLRQFWQALASGQPYMDQLNDWARQQIPDALERLNAALASTQSRLQQLQSQQAQWQTLHDTVTRLIEEDRQRFIERQTRDEQQVVDRLNRQIQPLEFVDEHLQNRLQIVQTRMELINRQIETARQARLDRMLGNLPDQLEAANRQVANWKNQMDVVDRQYDSVSHRLEILKDRLEQIRQARLEQALGNLPQRLDQANDAVYRLQQRLDDIGDAEKIIDHQLSIYQARLEEIKQARLDQALGNLPAQAERLDDLTFSLGRRVNSLQSQYEQVQNRIERARQAIQNWKEHQDQIILSTHSALSPAYDNLWQQVRNINNELSRMSDRLSQLGSRQSELESRRQLIEEAIAGGNQSPLLRQALREIDEELQRIQREQPVLAARLTLREAQTSAVRNFAQQYLQRNRGVPADLVQALQQAQQEGQKLANALRPLQTRLTAAQDRLAVIQRRMQEIREKFGDWQGPRWLVNIINSLQQKRDRLEERRWIVEQALDNAQEYASALDRKIQDIREKYQNWQGPPFLVEMIKQLEGRRKDLEERRWVIARKLDDAQKQADKLSDRISDIKDAVENWTPRRFENTLQKLQDTENTLQERRLENLIRLLQKKDALAIAEDNLRKAQQYAEATYEAPAALAKVQQMSAEWIDITGGKIQKQLPRYANLLDKLQKMQDAIGQMASDAADFSDTMTSTKLQRALDRIKKTGIIPTYGSAGSPWPGLQLPGAGYSPAGMVISGYRFGEKTHYNNAHVGWDLKPADGSREIYAPFDGIWYQIDPYGGWLISDNGRVRDKIYHLLNMRVRSGQHVEAGTLLGYHGETNIYSGDQWQVGYTLPHIHVERYIDGVLQRSLAAYTPQFLRRFMPAEDLINNSNILPSARQTAAAIFKRALQFLNLPLQWLQDVLWIVAHESGYNPRAQNPASTASGYGQILRSTWQAYAPAGYENFYKWRFDPWINALVTLRYIADRYGSASAAKRFWQQHHWYADGGWLSERVVGIGLRSGNMYHMAESGPERILSRQEVANLSKFVQLARQELVARRSVSSGSDNRSPATGTRLALVALDDELADFLDRTQRRSLDGFATVRMRQQLLSAV